jgi:protein MBA1
MTVTKTVDGKTETVPTTKEKDCLEYVVIQHLRWNNVDQGWRIWGTVSPTTLEITKTDPYFIPGLSALERLEMIKHSMTDKK